MKPQGRKLPRKLEIERELGRRGPLFWFVRKAWAELFPAIPFAGAQHVELICRHLEAVSAGKLKRLKIHVPPGHSKTLLVSVIWPVWEWIRFPHLRVTAVSYDGALTFKAAGQSKKLVESDWFRERWGDLVSIPRGSGDGTYTNDQGGERRSSSVGGSLTGHHMERLIIDDPTNPKYITDVALNAAERWYRDVVAGRLNIHLAVVLIMQRVHEADLSGILKEEDGWTELRLPAFYDPTSRCETPFGGDWRTEEEEVLAPDLQDDAILREKGKAMGPLTASAQLQQRPAPAGGHMFKVADFRVWYPTPDSGGLPEGANTPQAIWIQSWDAAFRGKATSDPVCGQTWVRIGSMFYLIDEVNRRMKFSETKEAIRLAKEKWPRVRKVLVELKANGDALMDELEKEIPGIEGVEPYGGKEARANLSEPLFASHQVFHPDPESHPWVLEHRLEIQSFPVAKHDDRVDAMSQAHAYLLSKQSSYAQAMAQLGKKR